MTPKGTFGPYNQLSFYINCLFLLYVWVICLLCMLN